MTQAGLVTCAVMAAAMVAPLHAATPPATKVVEAQRRMDFTGAGSYHRVGMLRELENTRRNAVKKQNASPPTQNVRVAKS